ncbi:helix-turn-helix transcriptional regulator [Streptomyces sp. NRRL F-5702]|uniref:helix-turn-helix transcriptional regulator n=1 Tax=Streptomyces sp. NRRL F-5702 TaxID=1463870 RepID=UPI0004CBCCEA|nr:helix-turn-helix domain-containing protein [Streptomyces sp. NRRL F-5702]
MKRPMLTQREAAAACGVSRSTIRRRREAGDLPGAVSDEARGWLIPVDDLLAAGFRLNAPAGPDATAASPAGTSGQRQKHQHDLGEVAALHAELERVRQEHALAVAEAEHGRQLAEAEARHLRAELAARVEHIADLQQTVRALMPAPQRTELGPSVPEQVHGHPAGDAEVVGGERRRWWRS